MLHKEMLRPLNLLYTYITVILILVIIPLNSTGIIIHNTFIVEVRLDYLLHLVLFIPWAFLFRLAINKNVILTVAYGWAFASLAEVIQYFLPYRAFNINDLLANLIGVLLGLLFFLPSFYYFLKKFLRISE